MVLGEPGEIAGKLRRGNEKRAVAPVPAEAGGASDRLLPLKEQ